MRLFVANPGLVLRRPKQLMEDLLESMLTLMSLPLRRSVATKQSAAPLSMQRSYDENTEWRRWKLLSRDVSVFLVPAVKMMMLQWRWVEEN